MGHVLDQFACRNLDTIAHSEAMTLYTSRSLDCDNSRLDVDLDYSIVSPEMHCNPWAIAEGSSGEKSRLPAYRMVIEMQTHHCQG